MLQEDVDTAPDTIRSAINYVARDTAPPRYHAN